MDSTTPIDISATGSPAATENIITILSWTGTILWLILSTLAIAFITPVSGRHIHARCKFRPIVSQYGSESMPYEVIPEIYCVVHTVAYGMTTLLVGHTVWLASSASTWRLPCWKSSQLVWQCKVRCTHSTCRQRLTATTVALFIVARLCITVSHNASQPRLRITFFRSAARNSQPELQPLLGAAAAKTSGE